MCELSDKTNIRETKDGVITRKITLAKFSPNIHARVKEQSDRDVTVCEIYSKAIENLKRLFDAGIKINLVEVPVDGKPRQTWLFYAAWHDLRELKRALDTTEQTIIHTAITLYLDEKS